MYGNTRKQSAKKNNNKIQYGCIYFLFICIYSSRWELHAFCLLSVTDMLKLTTWYNMQFVISLHNLLKKQKNPRHIIKHFTSSRNTMSVKCQFSSHVKISIFLWCNDTHFIDAKQKDGATCKALLWMTKSLVVGKCCLKTHPHFRQKVSTAASKKKRKASIKLCLHCL